MSNGEKDQRIVITIIDDTGRTVVGYRPPGDILTLETASGTRYTLKVAKSQAILDFDDGDIPKQLTMIVDLEPDA